MMQIRPEQLELLAGVRRTEFESTVVAHLRDTFPEADIVSDEDALRQVLREGWQRARERGIVGRASLRRFAERLVVHGPSFDLELAWARAILEDDGLGQREKLDAIARHEAFALRTEPGEPPT